MKSVYLAVTLSAIAMGVSFITPARAQVSVEIIQQKAEYLFDSWVHFKVEFEANDGIQEGFVFYRFPGSAETWVYEGELGDGSTLDVDVQLNAENQPAPFTKLEYWYRFASDHGDIFESQHYSLYYDDNRYVWQSLENPPFFIYWHAGDIAFAESILSAARQGQTRAQGLLPLAELKSVVLRVYDNPQDVQLIARQSGFSWQAGHTDPAAGTILLSLPPGAQQALEIQRQVPHEIAHLMLYRSLGAAYSNLPNWLNEGIASNAEVYSDPSRQELLDLANAGDKLIPFVSLCQAFPQDSASARLAYAQSASFVRYLHAHYNAVGFSLLVDDYIKDNDCVQSPLQDFGSDLNALDSEWRAATFAGDPSAFAWMAAIPWQPILLSAVVAGVIFLVLRFARFGRK